MDQVTENENDPLSGGRSSADPISGPLGGRQRFILRRRRLGSFERYQVLDETGETVLLSATRYGYFWLNLLAGLAGGGAGAAFALFVGFRALAVKGEGAQIALFLLAVLGGVIAIFLVDYLLSPRRDIRAHIPGEDRRAWLRLIEDRRINFHTASFTLYDRQRLTLARVEKSHLPHLAGKRWSCMGGDSGSSTGSGKKEKEPVLFYLQEDSVLRGILHRITGGMFGFFATDYLFMREGREIGRLRRRSPWRTRYLLELIPSGEGGPDPVLAALVAVLVDCLEFR